MCYYILVLVIISYVNDVPNLCDYNLLWTDHSIEQSNFPNAFAFLLDLLSLSRRASVVTPTIMMPGLIFSRCSGAVVPGE